ncbi:MAG: hypothetical protein RBS07_12380 [Lentimicrobium sp.]|nr:hypothetical protein [Lentimicrobium sp.]
MADLRKNLSNGISDNELLEQINNDSTSLLTTDRRKFSKEDNTYVDAVEWNKGISKDIVEDGKVYIVNIHEVLSPEPKQLDEARGLITADYQNFLEQRWIKELREKYPFHVNQEVLSSIK